MFTEAFCDIFGWIFQETLWCICGEYSKGTSCRIPASISKRIVERIFQDIPEVISEFTPYQFAWKTSSKEF